MKYLGGKHKIGKHISNFLYTNCPPDNVDGYLEPFCGSLGVSKNIISKKYNQFILSDIQPDLIEMWKELQQDLLIIPDEIDENNYQIIKHLQSPNSLKSVVGFGLSFGGKYFGGYSQKSSGNSGRNYLQEFKNSISKIKPLIQKTNISFINCSYDNFSPVNLLIYCDPPYELTTGYSTGNFDINMFWSKMREWSINNEVYISSENAPDDFIIVWECRKFRSLDKKNRFNKIEKLFKFNGLVKP